MFSLLIKQVRTIFIVVPTTSPSFILNFIVLIEITGPIFSYVIVICIHDVDVVVAKHHRHIILLKDKTQNCFFYLGPSPQGALFVQQ